MTASHAVACVNGVWSLPDVSIWNEVTSLPTITACAHSWRIARQAAASAVAMVVKRERVCLPLQALCQLAHEDKGAGLECPIQGDPHAGLQGTEDVDHFDAG